MDNVSAEQVMTADRFGKFNIIFANISGGKDSQVMLGRVVFLASLFGIQDRVVAVHADLGEAEWPQTQELARKHAECVGVPFHVVRRTQDTLLEYVERRGKWPDSQNRYCTSEFKRAPCNKLMTRLADEWRAESKRHRGPCRVLNCFGFRAEESPRRKKLPQFRKNKRASTQTTKHVWDWLPIQDWTEERVWSVIRASGMPYHPAYDQGMKRLSCRFCIFASQSQLMVAARQPGNQELFEKYVQLETRMGHTFKNGESLQDVKQAIESGEHPEEDDGCWDM